MGRGFFKTGFLVALSLLFFPGFSLGTSAFGDRTSVKKGILLVAFGTSVPEARRVFSNIERKVVTAYPDIPVRWAYTSSVIRRKLAKTGTHLDSPETALAKMMDEGFTHVAVQSLHTIAGEEFHDLRRNAHTFARMAGGFQGVRVGHPLLGTGDDFRRVVDAMIRHIPKERKKNDAVVFMGHGTLHPANASYAALMFHFQQHDPNIFVGTVEGTPTIGDIRSMLLKKNIKTAYLMPLMSVAGDHAVNDMAGDGEDSWKSILTGAGIRCVPVLKGTAAYDEIVDIWVSHLDACLKQF